MSLKAVALFLALESASLALAKPYPITGVKVDNGTLPIRRNIDDLAEEKGPQWDLYIQSLSFMYEMDSDDAVSYFQIAGIHGWPYIEWNNTGAGNPNSPWPGYCPHGEPIFLPWHRAYVVLYEQSLVETAKQIASQYPEDQRKEYLEAANSLRAPYWDWAATSQVPGATLPPTVKVKTPKGQKDVKNPLAGYQFPKNAIDGRYGDLAQAGRSGARGEIQRCPRPDTYPESADRLLNLQRNNRRTQSLREMVYDAFTTSQTFSEFASTGSRGISLEQIHNIIHIEATCSSDFLNSNVAGYDPLFMLHHSNVDRLWAYWQAIHPDDVIFTESYRGQSRYTTPAGTTVGPDSPLAPFFGSSGKPHTSKTVLSIQEFGYSYKGLENGAQTVGQKQNAEMLIKDLYSNDNKVPPSGQPSDDKPSNDKPSNDKPTGSELPEDDPLDNEIPDELPAKDKPTGNKPSDAQPPSQDRPPFSFPFGNGTRPDNRTPPGNNRPDVLPPLGDNRPGIRPSSGNSTAPKTGTPSNNGTRPDTNVPSGDGPIKPNDVDPTKRRYAQVEINVEEVERPCFVSIFVANVYAGSVVVMPQPATGKINGAVFLNSAIQKYGRSGNGSTGAVENNLHCEITKTDGSVIELSSVPSLKIEVEQIVMAPPSSDNELSAPKERKASPVSSVSPPPPGSAGSAGGPPLPPVNQDEDQGGYHGGYQGGNSGGNQGGYQGGNQDGKAKPKPKPATTSAAARLSPLPVLLLPTFLLLLI
ncbi:hypothetical protein XA68_17300 [Ophiocordyceps unilateralis]|uniref:tyrosinase n=1 Tax=Ophiocordyceps unilateralis TaxID=268505 RepID=A0A2A9PJB5_OPHUN|nr:hypothetical protein XA68_17300 [Ophiocordyceps unilateralis]